MNLRNIQCIQLGFEEENCPFLLTPIPVDPQRFISNVPLLNIE